MPRRVFTYDDTGLLQGYNMASTIGSFVMGAGMLVFLFAIVKGFHGRRAGNDPWLADTLEWYTTSPPPPHNFDSVPYVTSARPLYDLRRKLKESRCTLSAGSGPAPAVDDRCRSRRDRSRCHERRARSRTWTLGCCNRRAASAGRRRR